MGEFKNLRVLITVSDSKKNIERKDRASMVITVVNDGRPGLAHKVIKSRSLEVERVLETDTILFSSSMGVGLIEGVELVALEMIEHEHSSFIETTAFTNIIAMSDSYVRLMDYDVVRVAQGEVKEFELDGAPMRRLKRKLESSAWIHDY